MIVSVAEEMADPQKAKLKENDFRLIFPATGYAAGVLKSEHFQREKNSQVPNTKFVKTAEIQ